jgi:glycerol-3-phosphate acyltransferase PlsX
MNSRYTIALDVMGGDHGPEVVIPAALASLKAREDLAVVLVGDEDIIRAAIGDASTAFAGRILVQHASQRVEMDDLPSYALRNKKDSSMRVALNLVKDGKADACVSAGNTGALMATARFVLKTIAGIDRPAICTKLPSLKGQTWMLDLGANVDCSAEHLCQFALMGSVLASAVDSIDRPRVGLLNIGEEEIKGNEQVRKAALCLETSGLHYIGYVEGDDIYKGDVDVVVCDGFVGNVALKTSEGLAKMISEFMKREFTRNLLTKLAAVIALPVLRAFRRRIDPRRYNGASLLGLRGIVVKSHGGADALAFANAIEFAVLEIQQAVPDRINEQLHTMMAQRQAG